jgi:hypothetical protein
VDDSLERDVIAESTTAELREQVIEAYGGGCAICGEQDPELLQLDHVRGYGSRERKTVRGRRFYRQLIRQGYATSIQLLCVSCHRKKTLQETGGDTIGNTDPLHRGIRDAEVAETIARVPMAVARDCPGVEGLLRGVTERLDRVEMQLREVSADDHRALAAVRAVPAEVPFDSPSLAEAWKSQELARAAARREWLRAQRDVSDAWWDRVWLAIACLVVLLVGAGAWKLVQWFAG